MPDAEMRFGADASKLVAGYDQAVQGEQRWERSALATARTIARRENEMQQAMARLQQQQQELERQGTISIGSIAEKWGVVGKTIEGVIEAGNRAIKQLEEAGNKKRGDSNAFGRLGELASSQQDYNRMVSDALQLRASGVTDSREEAGRLQFQFESLGIKGKDAQLIANAKKFGVLPEADEVAKAVSVLQTAMGADKTGSIQQLLSKGVAAAAPAPTQFQNLMIQAGLAAPGANMVKMPVEDLLSGMGVLTKATGSPEEAKTMMQAFTKAMAKRGLTGRTIEEAVKDIHGAGGDEQMTEAQGIEFFGRQEGRKAYQLLRDNMGMYSDLRKSVYGATNQDLLSQKIGFVANNPSVAASVAQRTAEGQLEVSMEQKAIREQLYNARTARTKDGTLMGNIVGGLNRTVHDWAGAGWAGTDFFGGTEERQLREVAGSVPAAQAGAAVAAPTRAYQRKGIVIPQVAAEDDPAMVAQRAKIAEAEQRLYAREAQLREQYGKDGRVTPHEERRIMRDKEVQELTTVIKNLDLTLKGLEAKRRLNAASAMPPSG